MAARTPDPEPIIFSPPGYRWKGRQEPFSACCQGEDRVNHRHQAATPSVAHLVMKPFWKVDTSFRQSRSSVKDVETFYTDIHPNNILNELDVVMHR